VIKQKRNGRGVDLVCTIEWDTIGRSSRSDSSIWKPVVDITTSNTSWMLKRIDDSLLFSVLNIETNWTYLDWGTWLNATRFDPSLIQFCLWSDIVRSSTFRKWRNARQDCPAINWVIKKTLRLFFLLWCYELHHRSALAIDGGYTAS